MRISRFLNTSGYGLSQGSFFSMVMLGDRMFFNFTRGTMSDACYKGGYIRITFFLTSSLFPIPLVCMCKISVIRVFISSSHSRIYMGSFAVDGTVFLWYVSLPFNREICSLDVLQLTFSVGTCQAFRTIWIVIRAK